MKPKVYKIAAMALICLMGISANSFAQQPPAPVTPQPPVPAQNYSPAGPAIPIPDLSTVNGLTYQVAPLADMGNIYMGLGQQDTVYQKKMKKLQEQMADLRKQMSTLNTEERTKNNAEMAKRMAERSKEMTERFNQSFKSFGQNMNFRFNFDYTEDLDKKVASGEYKLKSRSYTKTYAIDANDKINIENHYGKVTVNTWTKNEVKVDVDIKAYANEDADAQTLLDQVKITDSKDNAGVSFNTVIGDENHKNNFWGTWTNNGKTTVRKTIINYTVYMPAKSALTLSNSYGAIILPELSGKVMVKNSYGSLTSKALTNTSNTIDVRYGAADIESIGGGDVNISYGSLNLLSADRLNAVIRYSPAKIGKLSTSGVIDLHYGNGLQIGNLDKNLKTLSVTSSYAPIMLNSLTNDNANFDVTVHYAGFNYNNGVTVTSKSPDDNNGRWSSTQTYKGHIGKGSTEKVITIKSNYGSVKFDQ